MRAEISSDALAAIRAHAAAEPGREACGLLLGTGDRIEVAQPAANVAPDPARHFEIDPAALFAAIRGARSGGPELVGYYHSHPSGVARPSARDAADAAADGRLWLIVGAGEVRAWRATAAGFVAVTLVEG
jgi:proteasome lid subunit RPN8/RPN11